MSTDRATDRPLAPFRRFLAGTVAVLVAVLGFLAVGATSASAAPAAPAAPATATDTFTSDGCTLVPEAPSGVSFHNACVGHDYCYFAHAQSRAGCDATFYGTLKQACSAALATGSGWSVYYSCRAWAALYYAGVRAFGGYFYNSTGSTRTQTPMQA
jgi:hypothetical protein